MTFDLTTMTLVQPHHNLLLGMPTGGPGSLASGKESLASVHKKQASSCGSSGTLALWLDGPEAAMRCREQPIGGRRRHEACDFEPPSGQRKATVMLSSYTSL